MVTQVLTLPLADRYYSLPLDVEIIPLGNEEWLCQSATRASRISGPLARMVVEGVLPLLQPACSEQRLVDQLPALDPGQLVLMLNQLVVAGVLRCTPSPPLELPPALAPLLALLETLHLPAASALTRLGKAHITIVGLEGVGGHLALLLARCGLGQITLVDPHPYEAGNLPLLPVGDEESLGHPRQEIVAQALRAGSPPTRPLLIGLGPEVLTRESMADLVAGSTCVVSCFDQGFAALHHWINRASLAANVPVVYAETLGQHGWAGPLVLPNKTACYMCYCMRRCACAPDSMAALAYEYHLDGQKQPRLHTRAVLPGLMSQLAGLLVTPLLQVALGLDAPVLAGRVLEYQALTLATILHPVVAQPDCPDCGGNTPHDPPHPTLATLLAVGGPATDLLSLVPELVSPQTGLIREVRWYSKDPAEPILPYICQVALANTQFQTEVELEDLTCSGKGLTPAEAQTSGLGEALERYGGDWVPPAAIMYARRDALDGASLDPRDLVLYTAEQYATVPYQPYAETSCLGWVRGRSLVTGERVYLPALAAFLGYSAQCTDEYLFPATSNGMAAGASLPHALLAALYEVLERDAFMITWFGRLATQRVDPTTHPDSALRTLCRAYRRRGVELGLWRLPTDHLGTVFLALGRLAEGLSGPAVIAGLGADLSPVRAARKALLEVGQIRPSYCRSLRRPAVQARLAALVANPQRVVTMHDHGLLYCSPTLQPSLDFLLDRPLEPLDWGLGDPVGIERQLTQLVTDFRSRGQEVLYYNLTPPDLARLGLAVTRVILPGFQPIAFGAQEPRLGGQRLYELPQQLDLVAARLTYQDLNPYPHPFD